MKYTDGCCKNLYKDKWFIVIKEAIYHDTVKMTFSRVTIHTL